jgi:WD40 repeat protein
MSTDHVIKVWDLRTNKCIQTLTADDWPRAEDAQPVAMVYDSSRKRLVTGGRKPFMWEQKLTMMDRTGHRSEVVKAVYNSAFFVVVSVDDSALWAPLLFHLGSTCSWPGGILLVWRHKQRVMLGPVHHAAAAY